jgi:hypothetical protein
VTSEHVSDGEGKIPRALASPGPVSGRSVVLVEDGERLEMQLRRRGSDVTRIALIDLASVADDLADIPLSSNAG